MDSPGLVVEAIMNFFFFFFFFQSNRFLPGKVGGIFPIAWHLERAPAMVHNSTGVGGSAERDPSSAPDVDTLQATPNPITAAAPGLKRPSGEGGEAPPQQQNMPLWERRGRKRT